MKKTMRFLCLAAFVAMGAFLSGCVKDLEPSDAQNPQEDVVVTVTTNLSFNGIASRAVSGLGAKTFVVGDKIAVVYTNTSDATVKVESQPLTASDISDDGKSADFIVSLTNPKTGDVTYVYPASRVNADGTEASISAQAGTLAGLQEFDYAKVKIEDGLTVNGSEISLPTVASLENQLAICKFWLKDNSGTAYLTGITSVSIYNGNDVYTISRSSAITWPIYVAMKPTSSAISFKASDGTNNYWKLVSGATLAAGGVYTIDVKMGVPGALPGKFSVGNNEQVHFSQGNLQNMGAAETRYWKFAEDQLDYLGSTSTNNSPSEIYVNRDLFGWGTRDNPCFISVQSNDYNWLEWGENAIKNGGNSENYGWNTLPRQVWQTLFNPGVPGLITYAKARIGGAVDGLILFPDNWDTGVFNPTSPNAENAEYTSNQITVATWKRLEAFGAVFLSAAGYRGGSSVSSVGIEGDYWSYDKGTNPVTPAWLKILDGGLSIVNDGINKSVGRSVRLVIKTTATAPAPTTAPVGAHPAQFNVGTSGDPKWVYFAGGNLQYIGSAPTPYLKFADSQYETIGPRQSHGEHENMDLFGWGTADQPYKSSTSNGDYSTYNDWSSSTIYSGATPTTGWRTLTSDEWNRLITNCKDFGVALIPGGYEGLIVVPASETLSFALDHYHLNTLSEEQWAEAQLKECLFLPKTGRRAGNANDNTNQGMYWSSTQHSTNSGSGYYLSFSTSVQINSLEKHYGVAIRLVKDVE